jgi:hypothetical protein
MYVSVFSAPKEDHPKKAWDLLKKFVDALNNAGRAKLQYIECKDPDIVEIREVRSV